jgi:putative spermidine/putrescine transport system permease protein
MNSRNGPAALAFHALFVAFILTPMVLVCAVAFTSKGYISLPTEGLSLRWFRAVMENPRFLESFLFSLGLGIFAATAAVILSLLSAIAIARHRFRGREAMLAFFLSPLMIPHVVLGMAFLRAFSGLGLTGTLAGLLAAHVILVMPYALRLALVSTAGLDRAIERAAESLGARPTAVFFRITLPLLIPGVVSGWVIAFITSFDELTMSIFIASPSTTTLPVRMFLQIEDKIDPLVTAVAALLIAFTSIAIFVLDRLIGIETLFVGEGR